MQLVAPAKINLYLRVLGRREDGFHEIDTVIAPITLADTIDLDRADTGIELACSEPSLPVDSANLAFRAAEEFLRATGAAGGVRIRLEKRIPHGAGLGGGSSDAAAVLAGMDRLFGTGLGIAGLTPLAARLGSDVPVFLHGCACRCRGRGEVVEPASAPAGWPLVLVKPAFEVPTPWAYRRWKESTELPGVDYCPQTVDGIDLVNGLERPVFEKFLLLPELKAWLRSQPGVRGALMSGSGSTVFAVLDDPEPGSALVARVRQEFGASTWAGVYSTC